MILMANINIADLHSISQSELHDYIEDLSEQDLCVFGRGVGFSFVQGETRTSFGGGIGFSIGGYGIGFGIGVGGIGGGSPSVAFRVVLK
jgi:hypothetical protein